MVRNTYWDWLINHAYILQQSATVVGAWAATFKEFARVQKPNTFTVDDALAAMNDAAGGAGH